MNQKDYKVVAEGIRSSRKLAISEGTLDILVRWYCIAFKVLNPRFNEEKFVTMCNKEEGK